MKKNSVVLLMSALGVIAVAPNVPGADSTDERVKRLDQRPLPQAQVRLGINS